MTTGDDFAKIVYMNTPTSKNKAAPRLKKPLTWYRWNADIGEIIACGASPKEAREQVMFKMSIHDESRAELEEAIAPAPQVLPNTPCAFVAWYQ